MRFASYSLPLSLPPSALYLTRSIRRQRQTENGSENVGQHKGIVHTKGVLHWPWTGDFVIVFHRFELYHQEESADTIESYGKFTCQRWRFWLFETMDLVGGPNHK